MISPRDGPQSNNPINRNTGKPMSDRQMHHLEQIDDTIDLLYTVMHNAEGSAPPGEHQEHRFQSRRMSIAATHVETAAMFARKAALESE